jgi:phosphate transport system permease protein
MSVRAGQSRGGARAWRSLLPSRESSIGDAVMRGLCIFACVLAAFTLVDIAYEVVHGAQPSIAKYGLSFIGKTTWAPNFGHFGAATMLFGTGVTALIALVIATPLALAIAIYLSMIAPPPVRAVVGPLVEMLAAIPSVILGFWGIIVLAPFMHSDIEPFLHNVLGFTGVFGTPQTTGLSVFTAGVILTVMVVPIIASLTRDLFLTVPRELTDGAEALGATRWEVIRGVMLPSTFSGVTAAVMLGLGRALGEAIAVASVIGSGNLIHTNLFNTGNTLAARIALEIGYVSSNMQRASLFYLALILLVIGIVTNVLARTISSRFDVHRTSV